MIRKLKLISKFVTSQTGKQIITTHIMPNVSRSKDNNETMELGQSIEGNMRNIFLQNPFTIRVEKLVPDPFLKNKN